MSQHHHLKNLLSCRSLFLGTGNKKKVIELRQQLSPRGYQLKTPADFDDALEVDETGTTFIENAELKASEQARHREMWALGEDSGLCVPALSGSPGIYSARYSGVNATDASNNALLLEHMKELRGNERTAYYVSTIALAAPDGSIHIRAFGECWGTILHSPRGAGGFGYDPLFEIAEYHATFAELGLAVKRAISHRGRSLRSFLAQLDAIEAI